MPIVRWIVVLFCCFFLYPTLCQAENVPSTFQQHSEHWSKLAEDVAFFVEKGKYEEARTKLNELAQQFSKMDWSKKPIRVDGIHALSEEIIHMDRQLNQVVIKKPKELNQKAVRLQITFDAVSHSNQPLWKQYYRPLQEKIQAYLQAKKKEDSAAMKDALQGIQEDYQMIRSALVVVKKPETVTKLDSLMQFIQKQDAVALQAHGVKRLQEMLEPLFYGTDQEVLAAYQPYVDTNVEIMLAWVSVWILVVLAYVSWRKYIWKRIAS